MMAGRSGKQLGFKFRKHGGVRPGAGRKPSGVRAGVSHHKRETFAASSPLHVTVRMADHVWNLRSRRSFRIIQKALYVAAERFGMRVIEFSVQGNHVHLLVEAKHRQALSQAMKGLSVRIAKGLNRMMGRRGRVIADRYHAHALKTPTEVRRALHYVRHNHRKHMEEKGERFPRDYVDPFGSGSPELTLTLPKPETWLLREGWRRGRT